MTKGSSASKVTDNKRGDYVVTDSGTNSQGNQWRSRDFGPDAPNQNAYYYANKDGSYFYSNPDGSTYYNDGQGNESFTLPDK